MSYIETSLMDGETVMYRTRPHAICCARPIAQVALGMIAGGLLLRHVGAWPAVAALAYSAAVSYPTLARFLTAEYGVTNKRIFVRTGGAFERRTLETAISKVAIVSVEQGIWGRFFNYGSVVLNGAGGIKDTLPRMHSPFEFRRKVFEQVLLES